MKRNPRTTVMGALLVGCVASSIALAADEKFAWREPFELMLPEATRTITLRTSADAAAFAARHGLVGARVVPMGRVNSVLEVPMDDARWQTTRADLCRDAAVIGCDSAVCQGIQLRGSATPGSRQTAQSIQARLVRDAPENLIVPDPANPQAGSCRGSPLVPALDQTGAATAGPDLNIDLTLLDTPEKQQAGIDADAAAENRSFQFSVTSRFNPVGGVDLGSDRLPADTSDWTLVVGAGCSEVKVPLNAIEPARVPGTVVALVSSAEVATVAGAYGLTVIREQRLHSTGQNLVTFATTQNIFMLLAAMTQDARVDGAQPEYVFETTAEAGLTAAPRAATMRPVYSDPFAAMNYAAEKSGALDLHAEASGNGQLIAVIDTGVDVAHPDLADRLRAPADTTDNGYAAELHGTAVAGIIAAEADNAIGSYGVAPGAEILPIKACEPKQPGGLIARCTTSTLVSALDLAMAADAGIINMSLAGPPDDLVARYVNLALDQGRLVVAGAGNGGEHAKPGFPAAIPGVLAVTAVDPADTLYPQANRGDYIDLAAPGVDIVSTLPGGQYPPLSGTSMAAAHITGIAALIRELNPLMTSREVAMVIRNNTRDLGAPGADPQFGMGLVDACLAAAAATADAVSCAGGRDAARVTF